MFKIIAVAIALCSSQNASQAQTRSNVVTGQIFGSDGSEITDAQVAALPTPVGVSGVAGSFSWIRADSHGRFRLILRPGRYVIRAKAEQAGYPNPDALLSADPSARFPTISVEQADISGVVVILGKKGAILEGYAYDSASKAAIAGTRVTLRDPSNPQAVVELTPDKTGHFLFAVPSKPILVYASAPGYKVTHFANGQPVTLSSGEHRTISIELSHQ